MVTCRGSEYEFRLERAEGEAVYVVGDFNGWSTDALAMRRGTNGQWVARVRLDPGTYHFRYYMAGGGWLTDFAAFGVKRHADGHWDSVLHVPHNN